jgi:glycosyltransferase involved in cell wall biosynthesis
VSGRRHGQGDHRVRLSVVIPALNEERHLGQLLADLQHQSRRPDEIILVDAGSSDATVQIANQSQAVVLHGEPPVACGRNLGGFSATGDLIIFLDADTRLPETFLEDFASEVERRCLDIACPHYRPYDSTPTIRAIHAFWNMVLRVFESTLPSGAGHCIALRGKLFRESRGFDPSLKFDDIELVRRLSKGRRFGQVGTSVLVSDRRYREQGILRTLLLHLLMAPAFALGKFEWANHVAYEFGDYDH